MAGMGLAAVLQSYQQRPRGSVALGKVVDSGELGKLLLSCQTRSFMFLDLKCVTNTLPHQAIAGPFRFIRKEPANVLLESLVPARLDLHHICSCDWLSAIGCKSSYQLQPQQHVRK